MLSVMYHYVRPNDVTFPNFKNLTPEQLIEQLDFFQSRYGFLSQNSFLEAIESNKPQSGVVLTFDDGFKDHYRHVLPILQERKLWAFFYIPTGHYRQKKILNVHRIHHLLGKYEAHSLLKESIKRVSREMLHEEKIREFDTEIYKDQQLSSDEFRFKRLFNYYLRHEYKSPILDSLFSDYFDEDALYKDLYLSRDELREMEDEGCIIGSHTVSHPVLSTLSYDIQKKEIEDSTVFLESFLSMKVKSFCYPYGGGTSYNESTVHALEACDIHHAFIVGNRPIESGDNRFELPRLDCNRFI